MNRRELGWALALVPVGWAGFALRAQAQTTVPRQPRIGVLRWGAAGDDAQLGLIAALAALGYVDRQSITIEWRFATSREVAQRYAVELVGLKPDLILASATPAAVAMKGQTAVIPIVLHGAADPVAVGLVQSMSRPGGNVTGVSNNLVDMVPKHLQLLGELIPGLQRVAFLGSTEDPATTLFVAQARKAAALLGVAMQVELIRSAAVAAPALDAMVRDKAQAVIVQPLFTTGKSGPLADLLLRRKLPAVTAQAWFATAGGLMTYGFSQEELALRAASFVDRILKGAAPASLPVEEPTSYELVINLATAKALGLVVPQSLLLRANRVLQ
jgi:putative tryptophan/tyrosine transport system substrate-binding protein